MAASCLAPCSPYHSRMSPSLDEQLELLMFGTEFGDPELERTMRAELREKLADSAKTGTPLKVYCGYDPSRPDIHIGHALTLRKLRQFQELGHEAIFLVGTFTAQVGDTSDKATGRPRKTPEEVVEAARTYAEQCFRILDRERTRVVYNADWLSDLKLADVVSIASNFTVQQFLVRDAYKRRLDAGNPIGLHEFFYALLQGWDAVHLEADVQLGASEQLFNILAGRKLQSAYGLRPCSVLTFPILVGTDGVQRMSKSTGNVIGVSEPPKEQFGKAMSISDETMDAWLDLVTSWTPAEVSGLRAELAAGSLHPMELKKRMAADIVRQYWGEEAAAEAREAFERTTQQGKVPDDVPEARLLEPTSIVDLLARENLASSKSEVRRLIQGGGVKIDGEAIAALDHVIDGACLIQVGKRRFLRVVAGS